jgi:SPP1 family predicted phage head-tail adaptor
MLAAGRLDQRITIEQQVESRGGTYSDARRAWETVATVWASVQPIGGAERLRAGPELAAVADLRVWIRWRSGLTSKMRLVHGSRTYEIVAPPRDVDSAHEAIELLCREYSGG